MTVDEAAAGTEYRDAVLATLLEGFPGVGLFSLDAEYRYRLFNEEHRRDMASRLNVRIAPGNSYLDSLASPEDRASEKAKADRALSGEAFTESDEGPDRWRETYWKPIRDSEGTIVGVLAVTADVGRRKRAEASALKGAGLLEESQSLAHLGGWEYDVAAKRVAWTAEVYRIHGVGNDFDPNDVERTIEFYAPSSASIVAESFDRALREGEPYDLELELRRADGKTVWVRTIAVPSMEDGRVVRIAGYIMDITERKAAQLEAAALTRDLELRIQDRTARLAAANAELESFAHTISHDLKAPLRAIAGYSRMVAEDYSAVLDDEGARRLAVVSENAARLDALISDIRALSRIGRSELKRTAVAMRSLAETTYRELAGAEDRAAISLSVEEIPDAFCDRALIRTVWENLLSNAVKFTAGKVPRTIAIVGESRSGEVRYAVRDNGAGFDPAYADKVFGLFRRLHPQGDYAGTGAGLAIVKRIVELHGGRVGAEGAEGVGAEFWFTLPAP